MSHRECIPAIPDIFMPSSDTVELPLFGLLRTAYQWLLSPQ